MNLAHAIALAAKSFETKIDKAGQPYILHCLRVMNNLHTEDEELKIIAVLHDYVEDIFKDNPDRGFTLLQEAGYSMRVIHGISLLTHRKGVSYGDYIKTLSCSGDAVKVKIADLKDNSDITRLKGLTKKDFDRMERYHAAYTYLSKI